VVKYPDLQIQRTIGLVFERFATLHSAQQVLRSLRADGLLLPRRQVAGAQAGELLWKPATYAAIYAIIRNPAYAGAFVYGRRGRCSDQSPGKPARTGWRSREAWSAIHQDVYPAYLSWEQYLANQDTLADNASRFARRARGAVRNGGGLLTGLVVCGRCGRQMRVIYRGAHRYICTAMNLQYRVPACLSLDGAAIDQVVVAALFAALAPAELDLLDEVLARQRHEHDRLGQQYADQVTRSEYEVRLAERRYRAADPDNRLVAAELERQWELALRARAEAHEAVQRFRQATPAPTLDPELRSQLRDVGAMVPSLWQSGRLTVAQQKALLRSLIRRIILTRPQPDTIEVKVIWVSGAISPLRIEPRLHRAMDRADYGRLVTRILALSAAGYQDPAIARQLTAEGFRSARSQEVPVELVYKVRHEHGQPARTEQFRRQAKIEGCWTVGGLARELQVTSNWLRKQIRLGRVPATRDPTTGRYLIADGAEVLEALKTRIAAR
jgi:hypothetical protein